MSTRLYLKNNKINCRVILLSSSFLPCLCYTSNRMHTKLKSNQIAEKSGMSSIDVINRLRADCIWYLQIEKSHLFHACSPVHVHVHLCHVKLFTVSCDSVFCMQKCQVSTPLIESNPSLELMIPAELLHLRWALNDKQSEFYTSFILCGFVLKWTREREDFPNPITNLCR